MDIFREYFNRCFNLCFQHVVQSRQHPRIVTLVRQVFCRLHSDYIMSAHKRLKRSLLDTCALFGYLRFSKTDRQWLVSRLALQIPFEAIIQEARLNISNKLECKHIISRSDLRNITKSAGLYKTERRDANGRSVNSWVRSFIDKDNNPFILYKRQGEQSFDIPPDDACIADTGLLQSDFLLGYMGTVQCEMLRQFGTGDLSVVCMDSTHRTSVYKFLLTTVMILDNNRQGFPVAFLFSTRETKCVLKFFIRAIRARGGIISMNSFIFDMPPQSQRQCFRQQVMWETVYIVDSIALGMLLKLSGKTCSESKTAILAFTRT